MERSNSNPVGTMFFEYNKITDISKCKIINCPHPLMKGRHSQTLEKHVFKRHTDDYKKILIAKSNIKNKNDNPGHFDNKRQRVSSVIYFIIIQYNTYFYKIKLSLGK